MSRIRKFLLLTFFVISSTILGIIVCDFWVESSTDSLVYNDIEDIPKKKVMLVLGTSKFTNYGGENLFFKYRIDAAAELYHNKKAEYILVSGDNSVKSYNETEDMKFSLMEKGVPEDKIVEDYAGFSTIDSVLRAKLVFGQDDFIIVSQAFHNKRAVFIAEHSGIQAIAYNAKAIRFKYSKKTYIREYLARVKAVLETVLLNSKPKFYKEKEKFPI